MTGPGAPKNLATPLFMTPVANQKFLIMCTLQVSTSHSLLSFAFPISRATDSCTFRVLPRMGRLQRRLITFNPKRIRYITNIQFNRKDTSQTPLGSISTYFFKRRLIQMSSWRRNPLIAVLLRSDWWRCPLCSVWCRNWMKIAVPWNVKMHCFWWWILWNVGTFLRYYPRHILVKNLPFVQFGGLKRAYLHHGNVRLKCARFEVLTAVFLSIQGCWDMKLCRHISEDLNSQTQPVLWNRCIKVFFTASVESFTSATGMFFLVSIPRSTAPN